MNTAIVSSNSTGTKKIKIYFDITKKHLRNRCFFVWFINRTFKLIKFVSKIYPLNFNFYKYQGAGNDFIMIDDRNQTFPVSQELIEKLCNRYFGIGADGLILLQNDTESDFKMIYFNSDGRESSMCGNGGRCVVRFAEKLGLIHNVTRFNAIDGIHQAILEEDKIHLKMTDVSEVFANMDFVFLNTGSPHHVEFVKDVEKVDVQKIGAKIRSGKPYFEEGTNVNFIEIIGENSLKIRTYERGVEGETLACGTGVTAAAIAGFETGKLKENEIFVKAVGGDLSVKFERTIAGHYENIWLTGPAELVFEGAFDKFRLTS